MFLVFGERPPYSAIVEVGGVDERYRIVARHLAQVFPRPKINYSPGRYLDAEICEQARQCLHLDGEIGVGC